MAFGGGTRRITILDRDPPPPAGLGGGGVLSPGSNRGATQLRHSHAFLGRLTTLIRERYPDLMRELLESGTRLFGFEDGLTPTLAQGLYRRRKRRRGHEAAVRSRRTTLELILRRYAAQLPGVSFIADAGVRGLISHREKGRLAVDGLKVERGGVVDDMLADVVVDASGRNTLFPEWLRAEGLTVREESSPCGILYYTRHYRLRDGQDEPPRDPAMRPLAARDLELHQVRRVHRRQPAFLGDAGDPGNRDRDAAGGGAAREFRRHLHGNARNGALDRSARGRSR